MPVLNVTALIENRVNAIRDYHRKTGLARAEIDVSGGIDSAVMLGLLVKALGPENVTAAFIGINSSEKACNRAHEVAKKFNVRLVDLDFTKQFKDFTNKIIERLFVVGYNEDEILNRMSMDPTILGSIRSTFRAPIGRALNRLSGNGGIRHGTGNEDEDRFLRFFQKGGDGEVDTNPISMLSKGEVFQLAIGLGVPSSILNARPSPDLWGDSEAHNDEDEIKNYLGLNKDGFKCDHTMYSYVDVSPSSKTYGEYTRVGLIERVARFCDATSDLLFKDTDLGAVTNLALDSECFNGVEVDLVEKLLIACKRVEASTRHKYNPNCPSLGNRDDLVKSGILTNTLPMIAQTVKTAIG